MRKAATYAEIEDALNAALDKYASTSPFLIHFRIATHGAVCEDNSHPFPLKGGGAMIHNGMLDIAGIPSGYSDSKYFANNVISKLPSNWYRTPHWPEYVDDMIGKGNKIVCLYPDALVVIGEARGNWKEGIWYSNLSGHTSFQHSLPVARSYTYGDYEDYGEMYARRALPTPGTVAASSVGWDYSPAAGRLEAARPSWEYDTYENGSWDETVLLMTPNTRRDLLRDLMQCDVGHMTDDDVEDFMLALPIMGTSDQDPLELMRDALLMAY
jgi:hypothetical protein